MDASAVSALDVPGVAEADPVDDRRLTWARDVILALATAWTTYHLYPNPLEQPAFARAASMLQDDLSDAVIMGIGPGVFTIGDTEVAPGRDGAERLAKALFLHDVEFAVVVGNATAEGILALFDLIDSEPDPDPSGLSVGERSLELDGAGLELYERGMLEVGPGGKRRFVNADGTEFSPLAKAAFSGASPEELAEAITTDADPSSAFVSGFEEVRAHVSPSRRRLTLAQMKGEGEDPWKGLRSLVEAFFFLPEPIQLGILEEVLGDLESERSRLFLDQLSGPDLAGFLPRLSEAGRDALLEYAVEASGSPDGQPAELLSTLQAASDVQHARQAMASRVSSVLLHPTTEAGQPVEDMLDQLRLELGEMPAAHELGLEVVRALLECEERPDRFRRIIRIWTGRVSAAIRTGHFAAADQLLNDILEDPPYSVDKETVVDDGLARMTTPELLRSFVDHRDAGDSTEAERLLRRLAPRVFDQMVERLGETDDAAERRMLTELLAASLSDVRRIEIHLNDPRWYVVRNLAIVLGKSGKPAAVRPLKRIVGHEEHRVRVEALRSLVRVMGDEADSLLVAALDDEHQRVRHTAVTLLKSSRSEKAYELLGEFLGGDPAHSDAAVAVIDMMMDGADPKAVAIVEALGSRKFAMRGNARAVRDAARAALKRRQRQ